MVTGFEAGDHFSIMEKITQKVAKLYARLEKFPLALRIFILMFLTAAATMGFFRWNEYRDYLFNASLDTIGSRIEATGQEYKGLEALVLGGIEYNTKPDLADISDPVNGLFQAMIRNLRKRRSVFPLTELYVSGDKDGEPWEKFITLSKTANSENESKNWIFVYVPSIALRRANVEEFIASINTPIQSRNRTIEYRANKEIHESLDIIQTVSGFVAGFAGQQMFNNINSKIVQSYFVLSTGVFGTRLGRLNKRTFQEKHYESVFDGQIFLPERPYFWKAIRNRTKSRNRDANDERAIRFDYVSPPYIDLSLNGPIQTYCWAFTRKDLGNDSRVEAVLCLDVELPEAEERIRSNLEKLNTKVYDIQTDLESRSFPDPENPKKLDSKLTDWASPYSESLSKIFGGINIFDGKEGESKLSFVIPLQLYELSDKPVFRYLRCELDLVSLKSKSDWWLLFSLSMISLTLIVLVSVIMVSFQRARDSRRAAEHLDYVMSGATDAYVRIDADNTIQNVNESFAALFGKHVYDFIDRKITEYIDNTSLNEFLRQKSFRLDDQPSEYEIKLRDGKIYHVYGAPIPVPREFRKPIPHTFGILKPKGEIN